MSVRIAAAANHALAPDVINDLPSKVVEALAPGQTLAGAITALGYDLGPEDEAFLGSIPPAIGEGIRAALFSAVTREPRVPVTMAWAPGREFELTVWEATGGPGAMTILLKAPSPG